MAIRNIRTSHGIWKNRVVSATETDSFWTPANAVTASGIVALIVAMVMIYADTRPDAVPSWMLSDLGAWTIPFWFLYGAAISDAVDGIVAQYTGKYSSWGRFMDVGRDRFTLVFIAWVFYCTNETLWWAMALACAVAIELVVGITNRNNIGSHMPGKQRYLLHLVCMAAYLAQVYWGPLWNAVVSFTVPAVVYATGIALSSLIALPGVHEFVLKTTGLDRVLARL